MKQLPTIIDSFSGPWGFLSNFAPCEVLLDGVAYPSVEHAYQAAKTLKLEQREKFLLNGVTPAMAKRMGRGVKLRPDWEEVKVGIMRDLLMQKFRPTILRRKLLSTFQAELIEGNRWGDTFWGVCNGVGENWLGKLLMEVRQFYGLGGTYGS
jgi:ribA/ribD-fused uncharacterized protein